MRRIIIVVLTAALLATTAWTIRGPAAVSVALITMHVWLWYPNPTGLFNGTNPNVTPFNATSPPPRRPEALGSPTRASAPVRRLGDTSS
jgi:hypothetical protein